MNIVIISGRMVRDPDVRYTANDNMAVARFTLAVDKNYKKSNDDKANFINCVAFGKTAEVVEKHCMKGIKLMITGEWTTGSYKNKDGNTVYTNDCNVSKLEFAESRNNSQNNGGNGIMGGSSSNDSFMSIPDNVTDEGLPFN